MNWILHLNPNLTVNIGLYPVIFNIRFGCHLRLKPDDALKTMSHRFIAVHNTWNRDIVTCNSYAIPMYVGAPSIMSHAQNRMYTLVTRGNVAPLNFTILNKTNSNSGWRERLLNKTGAPRHIPEVCGSHRPSGGWGLIRTWNHLQKYFS